MAGLVRLLQQKLSPPKPETASFAGRTILITGATTGLGLEAAKKLACLAPRTLIITARAEERGHTAKRTILEYVQRSGPTTQPPHVEVLLLDMSRFDPVVEFAKRVTTQFPGLDTVVLNAGTADRAWFVGPDGWESQLQVNALGTTLLALLLLPVLLANAGRDEAYTPHLEVVTSGLARVVDPNAIREIVTADDPLVNFNDRTSFPAPDSTGAARAQYARSKLVMESNMRRIARLPAVTDESGRVDVIVNSSCPGLCDTDLGREMRTGFVVVLLMRLFYFVFGRSAEQGANTLVSALTRGVEGHGRMWKNDLFYDGGAVIEGAHGRGFEERVWSGTMKVLKEVSNVEFNGIGV